VGQKVFVAIVKRIQDFRRDRPGDTFRGWLHGITQHEVADFWCRRGRGPVAAGGSDAQRRLEEAVVQRLREDFGDLID
jgi:RNA polymerase sigma-70 factor, ECF subfamily